MSEAIKNGKQILIDIIDNFSPDKFVRFFREKNRSFAPRTEDWCILTLVDSIA
jgi:hypothetical protein